jgi:general secretion pathway protein E
MPSPTDHFLPRRAFLESLLVAAWGGDALARGAVQAGQPRRPRAKAPSADARAPRLEDSGMRPKLMAQVRGLIARPHGMIVCCGPTGAVRTATLYACLGEVDPRKKVITIEDPIAFHLDRITQKLLDAKGGQTFADGLRSILEQHPDVAVVGEIRDPETAAVACRAAANGPLVLAGFQAGDTIAALSRLIEHGVEPALLAPALSAILAQRFVRVLCEACKEPYKPNPEFIKKANIPADKVDVFYRRPVNPQQACPQCGGNGYSGQTGIFELLVVTEPIREMIRRDPRPDPIKAQARKEGLIYIAEDGLRKVILGQTSVEALLQAVR